MAAAKFTAERVRELFIYDPSTGLITWRETVRCGRNKAFVRGVAGAVAGFDSCYGYWSISVDGARSSAHRVAWLYMTGEWPDVDIDHINGDRAENKWSNLRLATRKQNMQNLKGPHKDNTTGFLGVERHRSKYAARICVDGKRVWLGHYSTPEEAHSVYLAAKREMHERNTL